MVLCLATVQITLERRQIYFSALDIAMELHGRSGSFFSDLTSLLFMFSCDFTQRFFHVREGGWQV